MRQPPCTEASPSERLGDPNGGAIFSLSALGGWSERESPNLPWLQNASQEGQQRRILVPNGAAAAPNPFLDMCSTEMDSDRYFTDIMMGSLPPTDLSNNLPSRNEIQARDEVPAAAKGSQKRTKNFSIDEDKLLVSAWLNVSLDPVRGVNQSKNTYWERIHEYFHTHKKFESDRSQSSLNSRWSGILHDCNIFASCVTRIEARNQSGASVDDKQANALTLFKSEDRLHRTFQYIHCWKILKDMPKWKEKCQQTGPQKPVSKKQKTTGSSTLPTDAPAPVTNTVNETQTAMNKVDRPMGNKKEKEKLRQRPTIEALDYLMAKKKEADADKELKKEERELKKQDRELKKDERFQKALDLQEERLKLEKKKLEREWDLEDERIMNVDMSAMSTKQQQFYAQLQDKILARRLED